MKTLLGSLLALALVGTASAATNNNEDSCDIALLPAATLLLPYFEVDIEDPAGETTLVTITNVTNLDAIARVTLWTDRGYPVFTFNVPLTGYDVQSLNLYDILGRGVIARERRARGPYSDPHPSLGSCELPEGPSASELARVRDAFTTGTIDGDCRNIGGVHENAIGYTTIDVVGNCSSNAPLDREYWTRDLRHDNILLGDYQQIAGGAAEGGPLVHIRAMDGELPRTFYSRFTTRDARQPLPSQFAARFTEGTSLKIWREGRAGLGATCRDYAADVNLAVTDVVVFDEQENGLGLADRTELAASTKTGIDDPLFPQLDSNSGWMYLNLDRSQRDEFASQAWVISSTRTEDGYAADIDAIALANGCAPPVDTGANIAPANDDDTCDIALLPAATLLLPYFEVDLEDPQGETTIFTVTNVSPEDRIARVTLWTDYAFPVITFNIYLTGYDVQSINLYDVIARGFIAPDEGTGTQVTKRGPFSDRNFELDLGACARLVGRLPASYVERMQIAFTEGVVPTLGDTAGCNNVGNEHENAIGYATIDVVRNCEENQPTSLAYWTEDIAWDNVLIGEYSQIHSAENLAQSSTLVHIRAIPEGGTAEQRRAVQRTYDAGFPRTFYSRYQPANAPKLDGRQPLPSVFAVRWIALDEFDTLLKIWREGPTGRDTPCHEWDRNVRTWTETVRFDEHENVWADIPWRPPYPVPEIPWLPATSMISVSDPFVIPPHTNGARGGWIYINLDDDGPMADGEAAQNWVISSMRAGGRYSVDIDAAALGNGCSAETPLSETTSGTTVIGPRP